MAKDKKSFLIYCDIIYSIEHLTNEEKGILFQHLLEYVNDLNPVLENRVLLGVWKHIENQLKRDLEKYENTRKRNAENARKRWNKKNTKECDRIPKNANSAKNADNDTDNDTGNDISNNNCVEVKTSTQHQIDFKKLLNFINEQTKRTGNQKLRVINPAVKNKYKARLKDGYTSKDIANAIINACKEQHHKDSNYKYLTPDFFSRSKTLDSYAFIPVVSKTKVLPENFISNAYDED